MNCASTQSPQYTQTVNAHTFFHTFKGVSVLSVASTDRLTDSMAPFLVITFKDPITEYENMKEEPFCGFYLYFLPYYPLSKSPYLLMLAA